MKIKSELSPYEPAYGNIRNGIAQANIFDESWFDESGNEDKYHFYEEFMEQFADWMDNQPDITADLNEYRNKPFDAEYYFQQYMEDPEADHSGIEGCYQAVYDWVEAQEEWLVSEDNLGEKYRFDAGATDIEFYANEYDIKENAERIFKESKYTSQDVTHGFNSADDMVKAVMKCVDDGYVQDVAQYDGGSYGVHAPVDGTEEYFETGLCFLGNGEEEDQLEPEIPYSKKNDFADLTNARSVYRWFSIDKTGRYLYSISTMIFVYGIPWAEVERAGDELGLRNGDEIQQPSSDLGDNPEDIPMF